MVLTIDSDFGTARTALMTRRRTSRLPLGHQSLSWGALSVHRLGVEGAVGVGVGLGEVGGGEVGGEEQGGGGAIAHGWGTATAPSSNLPDC